MNPTSENGKESNNGQNGKQSAPEKSSDFLIVGIGAVADGGNPAAEKLSLDEPVRQLEAELAQLGVTIDQYEVQTEELKASNEELHLINEELSTVNQELKIKIEELSQSNNDFQNLISSTDIGTLFLDRSLLIKFFTPQATRIFNLTASDIGRPLSDITSRILDADLLTEAETVVARLQTVEREVKTDDGHFYLMRVLPYRTSENCIDGVIVTFLDITARVSHDEQRKLNAEIESQARLFNTTLSNLTDFAYIFDRDGRFLFANQPLLNLLEIELPQITGKNFYDLNYPDDLAARLQRQIQQVCDTGEIVKDETPFTSPSGASGCYEYIFSPVFAADGSIELVAGSTRDVTTRKAAEESSRFQAQLLNTVEESVIATDLDGTVIYWNHFAEKLYGWTAAEAVNRNIGELTVPQIMADQAAAIMSNLRQGESWAGEFQVQRLDGATFTAQVINSPIEDAQGRLIGVVGTSIDITERKQAEQALRESEERFRLLVESVTDYAIFTVTPDGLVASWNTGAEKVFGFKEKEIIGKSGAILFTPEDRERNVPEQEIKNAAENGRAEDERWHIRGDGSRFYASGVMMRLKDGKGFVKIARDMTDKIKIENTQRDKEMLQKLVGAQEDERKRIARDLHDELGQQLTALRFKLEAARKICEEEEVCGKIDEIQLIAKQIDADVDFLAWELRPAALDDLGLIPALENYVGEWSHFSGITAEFHASKSKKLRLAPEVEINLYRIAQEALNNTYKHAKAKSVSVVLEKRDNLIVLIVEDDGKGFNPKAKKNRSIGLGLIGMEERSALVGGTFEIESALKQGTTVYVRVPASPVKKEKKNV